MTEFYWVGDGDNFSDSSMWVSASGASGTVPSDGDLVLFDSIGGDIFIDNPTEVIGIRSTYNYSGTINLQNDLTIGLSGLYAEGGTYNFSGYSVYSYGGGLVFNPDSYIDSDGLTGTNFYLYSGAFKVNGLKGHRYDLNATGEWYIHKDNGNLSYLKQMNVSNLQSSGPILADSGSVTRSYTILNNVYSSGSMADGDVTNNSGIYVFENYSADGCFCCGGGQKETPTLNNCCMSGIQICNGDFCTTDAEYDTYAELIATVSHRASGCGYNEILTGGHDDCEPPVLETILSLNGFVSRGPACDIPPLTTSACPTVVTPTYFEFDSQPGIIHVGYGWGSAPLNGRFGARANLIWPPCTGRDANLDPAALGIRDCDAGAFLFEGITGAYPTCHFINTMVGELGLICSGGIHYLFDDIYRRSGYSISDNDLMTYLTNTTVYFVDTFGQQRSRRFNVTQESLSTCTPFRIEFEVEVADWGLVYTNGEDCDFDVFTPNDPDTYYSDACYDSTSYSPGDCAANCWGTILDVVIELYTPGDMCND